MTQPTMQNQPPSPPAPFVDRHAHLRLQLDRSEVGHFAPHDRQQILALVRRVDWLTERIDSHAREGRPMTFLRVERKAMRWALEQLGLTLPPNPPIPEAPKPPQATSTSPLPVTVTPDTVGGGGAG